VTVHLARDQSETVSRILKSSDGHLDLDLFMMDIYRHFRKENFLTLRLKRESGEL